MSNNHSLKFSGFVIVIFLCATFIDCSKTPIYNISIWKVDNFPHNIDQDFTIHIHHPYIKTHGLHAMIVFEVKNNVLKQNNTIFIYPGFLPKLERRLKETFFHITHFEVMDYQSIVVVRFFRNAQDGQFSIYYSYNGAETIHLHMPKDLMLIYQKNIHLFRPPILNLIIKTDDDHRWGLTINKPAWIICSAVDGFPLHPINVKLPKDLRFVKKSDSIENVAEFEFIAQLSDHLKNVTCQSGGSSISKQIIVFHHSSSVEISPITSYMKQSNKVECRSLGGGYPPPKVEWTVLNLNKTTKRYFTITSSGSISYLTINPMTPNNTQWVFNCSSINTIPHMDRSGPHKSINVTIGVNTEAARLAAARVWTISMVVVVLVIVLLVGILCVGSRIRCKSRHHLTNNQRPLEIAVVNMKSDYSNVNQDDYEDTKSSHEYVV